MSLITAVPRIDKGEFFICSCWWPELYLRVFHCTSFEPLFVFAFYGVLCRNCN